MVGRESWRSCRLPSRPAAGAGAPSHSRCIAWASAARGVASLLLRLRRAQLQSPARPGAWWRGRAARRGACRSSLPQCSRGSSRETPCSAAVHCHPSWFALLPSFLPSFHVFSMWGVGGGAHRDVRRRVPGHALWHRGPLGRGCAGPVRTLCRSCAGPVRALCGPCVALRGPCAALCPVRPGSLRALCGRCAGTVRALRRKSWEFISSPI